jgi:hypothetical protein
LHTSHLLCLFGRDRLLGWFFVFLNLLCLNLCKRLPPPEIYEKDTRKGSRIFFRLLALLLWSFDAMFSYGDDFSRDWRARGIFLSKTRSVKELNWDEHGCRSDDIRCQRS